MFLVYCLILEEDATAILSILTQRMSFQCQKKKDLFSSAKDIQLTHLDIWSADIFTVSQAATKTELQQSNGAGNTVGQA